MRRILTILCFILFSHPALALTAPDPETFSTLGKYAVIMDARSGAVLYSKKADVQMPTSSMSKVMTMYLVFEALDKGALRLDQKIRVSKKAWKVEGSRMFLRHTQRVAVEDLIRGVIVQSGNDASIVLAEAVAGSEDSFASLMNSKAEKLGMKSSHFMNATGLPHKKHYSTARDLAILTRALMNDYPQYYHYYSEKSFTYNKIKQGNRNPLLYLDPTVDGVKTGHTEIAGYGLISSALRDGRRVITVINGLKSKKQRGTETAKLLNLAYLGFKTYKLVGKGKIQGGARVWLGVNESVSVVASDDILLTLSAKTYKQIRIEKNVSKETRAPIRKGQVMGQIVVIGPDLEPVKVKLLANEDVPQLGFIKASFVKFKRMLQEMF